MIIDGRFGRKTATTETSEGCRELTVQHWDLLDRLSRKRFPDPNLSDQALLFVQREMERNNWQRLKAFKGRSRFSTFLTHITLRLFEDFNRRHFGRVRLPEWLKSQDPLWTKVYQLLCMERFSPIQVLGQLTESALGGRAEKVIEEAIDVILERSHNCGQRRGEAVPTEPELLDGPVGDEPALHQLSPEGFSIVRERLCLLEGVRKSLHGKNEAIPEQTESEERKSEEKKFGCVSECHH